MIDGILNQINQITSYFSQEIVVSIALALIALFIGLIIAKLVSSGILFINSRAKFLSRVKAANFARMVEYFLVLISIIVSLNFLQVNAARTVIEKIINFVPDIIIILLLSFLGIIAVNLVIDLLKTALKKIGLNNYVSEFGFGADLLDKVFLFAKIILFLILFSVSLNIVGYGLPFFDQILLALIFGLIVLSVLFIYFVFREQMENFFLSGYIEKNILKHGQTVLIDNKVGEVTSINSHGVTISMGDGYNLIVPNKKFISKEIYVKRSKLDISLLEQLRENFVAQMPALCGPASASMLLNFFGFDISQEVIAKTAKTKVPGGTGPRKLAKAVRELTLGKVKGVLIKYDEISELKKEVVSWLSEGALIIVWFSKKALFKESKTQGHYSLCVGVEDDELVILDPSKATAGVYLINYRLFEEAMGEKDKKRGYLVFAKKGTPAYWRINEGLIYSDVDSYKDLSKSFERYLKRILRKSDTITRLLSEHLSVKLSREKPKRIWKPNLKELLEKKKEEEEKELIEEEKELIEEEKELNESEEEEKELIEEKKEMKEKKMEKTK
ncbi:MAG: C39 family peptidase [Candidatus Diapherotrites archaeon]|nr:C39 family peptidase [Candidatus Diapherotrites archaeon]